LSTWRVGQVLAATVTANPQPGQSELRIGNLLVRAQTGNLELTPGQNLRLEVASLKEQPVLKLLGLLQQNPVLLAVRDTLPRQQPLAPLFSALARLAGGAAQTQDIAPAIARLAREFFHRLPDSGSVATASGLRQALRDSGLFLESKLAAAVPPGASKDHSQPAEYNRDIKANLLRLVSVLRDNAATSAPGTSRAGGTPAGGTPAAPPNTTPTAQLVNTPTNTLNSAQTAAPAAARAALIAPAFDTGAPLQRGQPPLAAARLLNAQELALTPRELQRQADGALARVQLNQLSSLPQERQPGMEWLIELPVRREQETDIWNLRISREPERDGERAQPDETGGWSVMLAFDLPGIGPMQTRVNLRGEQISAQFFSQTPGILSLVREHLPFLQARLRQAGLQIDELSCHHGQIPAPVAPKPPRLLDERA
jgi:hypothetical protein